MSVIKYLRNSKGAASVFALPKHPARLGINETSVQHRFGDPLADRLGYILTRNTPYNGELGETEEIVSDERFLAYRISDHAHLILDSAYKDGEHEIPTRMLENPDFEPSAWFARRLQMTGGGEAVASSPSRPMGDARATRICEILNNAEAFPGDDLPDFHPRRSEY
ncbi:hypothetical protein F5890DRAFT_1420527, partial [Lentinula detonsa]